MFGSLHPFTVEPIREEQRPAIGSFLADLAN
jgi:hypothetical protein